MENKLPWKFLWPKSLASNDASAGFTLLETLIAITIMTIAFASILSVQSSSINASTRARQMSVVAMLVKGAMVDTEFEIQGKTFEEVKKDDGASFKAPFQDYRWTRTIKEIEFPNLNMSLGESGNSSSSQGTAGGSDTTEMITKLITQFLSKAVREVTVTIFWKKSDKEMSYSITTYWVDLNHEFQLSQ